MALLLLLMPGLILFGAAFFLLARDGWKGDGIFPGEHGVLGAVGSVAAMVAVLWLIA